MTLLTREAILAAPDLPTCDVEVPEWGGAVRVRGLTGRERDAFEASVIDQRGRKVQVKMENLRARLVSLAAIDESGKRLFKPTDVEALGEKSAAALERVFNVAQRLSGISESDIEELAQNFENGQSDDSTSD